MTLETFVSADTASMKNFANFWKRKNPKITEQNLFDWVEAYEAFAK